MGARKESFSVGEWYHCYNQSVEKRAAFVDGRDYHRFLELLYLANDDVPFRRNDIGTRKFEEVLTLPRNNPIVAVGAFCLLPTHFHVVLKELVAGGISSFMRKIGTAYTLYFNSRHERVGNLFLKPFKSRPLTGGPEFQSAVSYVHCSPAVLYEPEWKTNYVADPQFLRGNIQAYPYSSIGAYEGAQTPLSAVLDRAALPTTIRAIPIQKMLQEARLYCAESKLP